MVLENQDEILEMMNNLFWYPKIPEDQIIDPDGKKWAAVIEKK